MKRLLLILVSIALSVPLYSQEEIAFAVYKVVDGDTIRVGTKENNFVVRLIGIDTPETVHPNKPVEYFGKEASAHLKKLLEGQKVVLKYEPGMNKDKYGRVLAFVYRVSDNLDVNLEIIKAGYGHAYTRFPFSRMEEFRKAEREARERGSGLWKNN